MGYIDEESIARSHSKRMSRYNAQQAGESGRKGSMADAEPWVVFYIQNGGVMKKKVVILLMILLAIYFVPIPIPVNKTLEGFTYREGEEQAAGQVTVDLHGIYWLYLLQDDAYNGDMEISGGGFTELGMTRQTNSKLETIRFSYDGGGFVSYSNPDIYPGYGTHYLGFLDVSGCMDRIRLSLPVEEGDSPRYLVAPLTESGEIKEFVSQWV